MGAMKPFGARRCKLLQLSIVALILGLLSPNARAMPDLVIAGYYAQISIEYARRSFSTADCAYQEACVHTYGTRKLLLVDVGIRNVGKSDLVIGVPWRRPDLFGTEPSPCHGHYHLKGLATYRVLTLGGRQVAKTYKQGFCLRDDTPRSSTAGPGKFTCDYQGLSAGWQDTYDKSLDCQWVDITGVAPGTYNLEITVNPKRLLPESNYGNNKVILRITVPKKVY
jgi:hypothetical protein